MSSSSQIPSETTVLLPSSQLAGQSSRSPTRRRSKLSSETVLIPVALATSLAAGVPSTTLIELVRQAVCRVWNTFHADPATLMTSGQNRLELCNAPEIARCFAIVLAVLGATKSAISIAGFGVFSRISSHYGRKPTFLLVLLAAIMSSCIIAGSQYMPDQLADCVLLLGMLCGVFSTAIPYLIDMYIVDGCVPADRTAVLSRIAGWAGLGICMSFVLGGTVTTKTGNPVVVFYMTTVLYVAAFVYVAFILPESFPQEKRNALSRMHTESFADGPPTIARFTPLHIFKPLEMLVPTRRLDGTRNWRLAWCAAHVFLFMVANSYAPSAWLVIATSEYHLSPADTGLFFTVMTVSGSISLIVIVPSLVRFLQQYYRRKTIRPHHVEENAIRSEELESETSDHLHVHMAFVSCVVSAISFSSSATFVTNRALLFCSAACIGFTFVHGPTVRGLAAGSVDPLKQGEALAAIEMVSNAGSILSPVIMGSVLTATYGATPPLVCFVHMAIVLISSSLLFLVRDADRYQKPCEA